MSRLVDRFTGARRDPSLAVLEGFHPLKHALRFGAEVTAAASPDPGAIHDLARQLAPDLAQALAALVTAVPPATFARLAPHEPATGVVAVARRPPFSLAALLAAPGPAPVVLLERPTHLGNLGAAVRVAAAAGAAGVIAAGVHDPWHPEALRGGAGLQFALPVGRIAGIADLPASVRPLVALHPAGEPLRPGLVPARAILAFGSERRGLSAELLARAHRAVAIPMRPGVSSLNLATAVAVALYWPARTSEPM
jgi:RNA methyltransferase, TrmH family